MRKELVVKGKSLTGTSDLTLLAPIKKGFVSSLDALTYKTRAKRLMKSLTGGRASMHEYSLYRPLSDSVERVAVIHSFRVMVIEPEDKILLAVTFDGTWESYIRILWQKVGTLLDIIFCNTEGYVISHSAGFEAWADWVRRVQIETDFYYNTHGLTVPDVHYLRGQEAISRLAPDPPSRELAATRHAARSAEEIAWAASHAGEGAKAETLRQGLQSLAVLFRMTDTYLPGTADGDVLKRAAQDLLVEFKAIVFDPAFPAQTRALMDRRFKRQLRWLDEPDQASLPPRPRPTLPDKAPTDMHANLQAGILSSYEGMTHGCLLMLAIDDSAAGAALLDTLIDQVSTEAAPRAPGQRVMTFSISYEGLRALGLTEEHLALFPQEFREGMEARASMLGDFRVNHPRRWRLPQANWGERGTAPSMQRIQMSTVHVVVQMRVGAPRSTQHDPAQRDHPLHDDITRLMTDPRTRRPRQGVRLLHVQPMRKLLRDGNPVEHFGFVDGVSDPVFNREQAGKTYPNQLAVGEFLWGRETEADVAVQPDCTHNRRRLELLGDGSFLVVRRLSQDVPLLHNLMNEASAQTGLNRELILAKMMGRDRQGDALAAPGKGNDFDYLPDPQGSACPFHSHIRRANPRAGIQVPGGPPVPPGGRQPRIMRRGMSFGAPYRAPAPGQAAQPDGVDRGMVFMAYVANLAEQFETVQRWLTGGNSSGGFSRHSDPFLGVPEWRAPAGQGEPGDERRGFRFEHEGRAWRVGLDEAPELDHEPRPLVRLDWGLYLFAPTVSAARKLRDIARAARRTPPVWSVREGALAIHALAELEQVQGPAAAREAWKSLLEDGESVEKFRAASAWAAIRTCHGGVLRTPYGLLVADRALVMDVLNDRKRFTVAGYNQRMRDSLGEIYLGLDAGPAYQAQATQANAAISAIGDEAAFTAAFRYTQGTLAAFIAGEVQMAQARQLPRWELNLDAKEVVDIVLARLCQDWFGLSDKPDAPLVAGSWRWDWKDDEAPIYPAQFTAPSRFIFQPWPNENVEQYAVRMGRALTESLRKFIAPHRAAGTVPSAPSGRAAPLAQAAFDAFPQRKDDDLVARTLSGMLMGMLPTVDGNIRASLNEWLRDGTFWSLRAAWAATPDTAYPDLLAKARELLMPPLVQSMQLRPTPEMVWRKAAQGGFQVGHEEVRADEVVVVSLVSAAHQCLEDGKQDLSMVFGGRRKARGGPTHACPGYGAGMGIVLGLLAGLVAAREFTRPSPAPLSFTFEGLVPS